MLTEELILKKCPQKNLNEIKIFNLWGYDIENINIISKMHNLEILSLSVNKISTLKPLKNCFKLKELYLRKNNISSLKEIDYLKNLQCLKILRLEENPICKFKNYTNYILNVLPNLYKLDSYEIEKSKRFKTIQTINQTDCKRDSGERKILLKRVFSSIVPTKLNIKSTKNKNEETINSTKISKKIKIKNKSNLSFLKLNRIESMKEFEDFLCDNKNSPIQNDKKGIFYKKLKLKIFDNKTKLNLSKHHFKFPISKSGFNLIKKNESNNISTITTSKELPNISMEKEKVELNKYKMETENNLEKILKLMNKLKLSELKILKKNVDNKIENFNELYL
jgi:hypothetical protein